MNNLTRMKIRKPAGEVFEAFVDPAKIGKFWFSSSSGRWEQGKAITLRYDEYEAKVDIQVTEIETNRKIAFRWGGETGNTVTITFEELDGNHTLVAVNEVGFREDSPHLIRDILDNKEGWVYMLTCLKGYLEFGADLRAALVH